MRHPAEWRVIEDQRMYCTDCQKVLCKLSSAGLVVQPDQDDGKSIQVKRPEWGCNRCNTLWRHFFSFCLSKECNLGFETPIKIAKWKICFYLLIWIDGMGTIKLKIQQEIKFHLKVIMGSCSERMKRYRYISVQRFCLRLKNVSKTPSSRASKPRKNFYYY